MIFIFTYLNTVPANHKMFLICSLDFGMIASLEKCFLYISIKFNSNAFYVLKKYFLTTRKMNLFRWCFLVSQHSFLS